MIINYKLLILLYFQYFIIYLFIRIRTIAIFHCSRTNAYKLNKKLEVLKIICSRPSFAALHSAAAAALTPSPFLKSNRKSEADLADGKPKLLAPIISHRYVQGILDTYYFTQAIRQDGRMSIFI